MAATQSFSGISLSEYSEAPSEADVTMATQSLSQALSALDSHLQTAVTPNNSTYSTNTAVPINDSEYSFYTANGTSQSNDTIQTSSSDMSEATTTDKSIEIDPISFKNNAKMESIPNEWVRPQTTLSNMSIETGVSNLAGGSDSGHSVVSVPQDVQYQRLEVAKVGDGTISDNDLITCISDIDDDDKNVQVMAGKTTAINDTKVAFSNGNQFIEINGMLNQAEPFNLGIELEPVDLIDSSESNPSSLSTSVTFSISEIDSTTTAVSSDAASPQGSEINLTDDLKSLPNMTPRATHACVLIKNVQDVIDEAHVYNNITQEIMASDDPVEEPDDFWSITLRVFHIPINFATNVVSYIFRFNLYLFKLPFVPLKFIYNGINRFYDNLTEDRAVTDATEHETERMTSRTDDEEQRLRELEHQLLRTRQASFSFSEYSNPASEVLVDPEGTMPLNASTSMAFVPTVTTQN